MLGADDGGNHPIRQEFERLLVVQPQRRNEVLDARLREGPVIGDGVLWGAGEEARRTAGGMSAKGRALILLPKGTVARAQPLR